MGGAKVGAWKGREGVVLVVRRREAVRGVPRAGERGVVGAEGREDIVIVWCGAREEWESVCGFKVELTAR